MEVAWILIGVIILILLLIAVIFVKKGKTEKLSILASLSFAFVIAGVIFGDNRILGYCFIGTGIILAVIDVVLKNKRKGGKNIEKKRK